MSRFKSPLAKVHVPVEVRVTSAQLRKFGNVLVTGTLVLQLSSSLDQGLQVQSLAGSIGAVQYCSKGGS